MHCYVKRVPPGNGDHEVQGKTSSSFPRRFPLLLAVALSAAVLSAAPSMAATNTPAVVGVPTSGASIVTQAIESLGIQNNPLEDLGLESDRDGTGQCLKWVVQWKQVVRWYTNGTKMRHDSGQTTRLEGCDNYKARVHTTLIKGHDYFVTPEWSHFGAKDNDACASTGWQLNKQARTCSSPYQNTSKGAKWLLVSGHDYDNRANSSVDGSCAGCIDWKWTVPD